MTLCNSWIVVDRTTRQAVFETWSSKIVEKINMTKYEVLTAYEYLVSFNRSIAAERGKL